MDRSADTNVNIGSNSGLNIGDAEKASGVSAKMIRHYESIGLIGKAARTYSGYRVYADKDIHVLRFVRQARNLGFSIKQIGELLALWNDRRRSSSKVKQLALAHIGELNTRILEMQAMKSTLEKLAQHCHGDDRPECPILQGLETGSANSHCSHHDQEAQPQKQAPAKKRTRKTA